MNTVANLKPDNSIDDSVDNQISEYLNLENPVNFFLFAGAGSGKTRSLVKAMEHIRDKYGPSLELLGRRVGVITYTNAACDEIKDRVENHSLFQVSTIHSFAWELIKGFDYDICDRLQKKISNDILELKEKLKPGTKSYESKISEIESKENKFNYLQNINSFKYNPSGENTEENSLNHSEVLSICSELLTEKDLMRWILVGRFPFLLIDEAQDTNKRFMDALLEVAKEQTGRICIGLVGDVMQRIYLDGKEKIVEELPDSWKKPTKKLNHRCPKRVVRLINMIREDSDNLSQEHRSDAEEGTVRVFIRSNREKNEEKNEIENGIRHKMVEITGDEDWKENCKILTLEHHMSATRLGFSDIFNPLNQIRRLNTGLRDGDLPELRIFTNLVLPVVDAHQDHNRFLVSKIMRENSPLLTTQALKDAGDSTLQLKKALLGVEALTDLWKIDEPSCGDVLLCIDKHKIFKIPDTLIPIITLYKSGTKLEVEESEKIKDEETAFLRLMNTSFEQIRKYHQYVSDQSSFGTHHGVKGLEFDRVMVIMDDLKAAGKQFSYGKLFGDLELSDTDQKNVESGKDNSVARTRRLFYVTCSRAKKSLALVAYCENPEKVKNLLLEREWFSEDEIDTSETVQMNNDKETRL